MNTSYALSLPLFASYQGPNAKSLFKRQYAHAGHINAGLFLKKFSNLLLISASFLGLLSEH